VPNDTSFDYNAPAELFLAKRAKKNYWRFTTAAEAIRFVVGGLTNAQGPRRVDAGWGRPFNSGGRIDMWPQRAQPPRIYPRPLLVFGLPGCAFIALSSRE
jgi:hypothetical protein